MSEGSAFALATSLVSNNGAFFVGDKLGRALPESDFHVSDGANRIGRVLDVDVFRRFLDLILWNRVVRCMKPHLTERRPPKELYASVRSSGMAHAWGAAVHLVVALVAAPIS